jgi:hypothetical protein
MGHCNMYNTKTRLDTVTAETMLVFFTECFGSEIIYAIFSISPVRGRQYNQSEKLRADRHHVQLVCRVEILFFAQFACQAEI